MAKTCIECGKKLSFFQSGELCKDCKVEFDRKKSETEIEILKTKKISDQQKEFLKRLKKKDALFLWEAIYSEFESDSELDGDELAVLNNMQEAMGLSTEDIKYNERILPYFYVNFVRTNNRLPEAEIRLLNTEQPILKKNETIHFGEAASLKELKSVSLGYRGGSHGVSIPIVKGVRYRVGAHRGHIVKEDRYVTTSNGVLFITNQRLFLHPFALNKPVSLPLKKILSYRCYEDGIEVYKEGREKGYLFTLKNSGSAEVFGLCLGHLLGNQE